MDHLVTRKTGRNGSEHNVLDMIAHIDYKKSCPASGTFGDWATP
jgi:hypothetical protein